jgi:hypothetical protein
LKLACQSDFEAHERLLEGWYKERKQQLEKSLPATVENGKYAFEGNSLKILFRDTYHWMVQLVPSWKRQLEKGARLHGMCRYEFKTGMHFIPELEGGLLLPQVYCSSLESEASDDRISFTDQIYG